ncbi:MAG: RluA family pseudouridine synthase [Bdellovibrionales bacterium]|nr:RluA family pseudouridine synthase [Bdellovibrionales bacterium]
MKTEHLLTVSDEHSGLRLDKWLSIFDIVASRSRAAELIDRGLVTLNGKALKASYKVQSDDIIRVELPAAQPSKLIPLDAPLDILFEDEDVVVVNKPAGLVVHPAAGHAQDTLVNLLLHHVDSLSMGFNEQRPGIVHRLDRDTSGVLVVAKNDAAHRNLAAQFKDKTTHRVYHALVHGVPKAHLGTLTTRLARHPQNRKRFASTGSDAGKLAITHYQVLQSVPAKISLLQCRLETGRTHQIRVHLSEAGHALVGDVIYGSKSRKPADLELGRLGLHAAELGFSHPRTHKPLLFKQAWPEQFATFAHKKGIHDVST